MEQFKKELKALLQKYNASITIGQDEDDSFLYLNLEIGEENTPEHQLENIDSGYKCIAITKNNL